MDSPTNWQSAARASLRLFIVLGFAASFLVAVGGISGGWPAVEGVGFALVTVAASGFLAIFAGATSSNPSTQAFRAMTVGMLVRMGFGVGSAFVVRELRPDCFRAGYLVWLILLYALGLGYETWHQRRQLGG